MVTAGVVGSCTMSTGPGACMGVVGRAVVCIVLRAVVVFLDFVVCGAVYRLESVLLGRADVCLVVRTVIEVECAVVLAVVVAFEVVVLVLVVVAVFAGTAV